MSEALNAVTAALTIGYATGLAFVVLVLVTRRKGGD